jgi:hypothetical protein
MNYEFRNKGSDGRSKNAVLAMVSGQKQGEKSEKWSFWRFSSLKLLPVNSFQLKQTGKFLGFPEKFSGGVWGGLSKNKILPNEPMFLILTTNLTNHTNSECVSAGSSAATGFLRAKFTAYFRISPGRIGNAQCRIQNYPRPTPGQLCPVALSQTDLVKVGRGLRTAPRLARRASPANSTRYDPLRPITTYYDLLRPKK